MKTTTRHRRHFSFLTGGASVLVALLLFTAGRASAQTTLLDTFSLAETLTLTTSTPRTYMGNSFTNNSLPAGTTGFQISDLTIYMASGAAASYSDIVARLQFWNSYNANGASVFSNAAGAFTIDLGALTTAANTFYTIDVTLATPITLTGGAGTNWGFVQNFQGNTGGGLVDNTNLTSLITASTTGYAAGTVTNGSAPAFGYYRNASGRTDFNFSSTDSRTLAGLNNQAIAIIINGAPIPEPSSTMLLLAGGAVAIFFLRYKALRA
jgi:hypothetical protein